MQVTWGMPDPQRIVVAGDWHGSPEAVRNAFTVALQVRAGVIVQLGDFGLWPGRMGVAFLDEVEAYAVHTGIPVAWIDGNHEDFDQLLSLPIVAGRRAVRDHVWHLPRGASWSWHGHRFRALGGATSLDRPHRVPGRSWWPQEEITAADLDAARADGPCDVLLTHDCPSGVDVPGIGHRDSAQGRRVGWPAAELERAWDHRDRLAGVVAELAPAHLWHGHFHVRYSATASLHPGGLTQVEGLAGDGEGPYANLMVVSVEPGGLEVRGVSAALYGADDA